MKSITIVTMQSRKCSLSNKSKQVKNYALLCMNRKKIYGQMLLLLSICELKSFQDSSDACNDFGSFSANNLVANSKHSYWYSQSKICDMQSCITTNKQTINKIRFQFVWKLCTVCVYHQHFPSRTTIFFIYFAIFAFNRMI